MNPMLPSRDVARVDPDRSGGETEAPRDALSETMQILLHHKAVLDACVHGERISLKISVSPVDGATLTIPVK